MERFTDFERSVLDKALSGDDPILATLREQALSIRITERELTGRLVRVSGLICGE